MTSNNKPIDPAVIITMCDRALDHAQRTIEKAELDSFVDLSNVTYEHVLRKIRAARDMIKRHEYG